MPFPIYDNILHDNGYYSEWHGKWHLPLHPAYSYDVKPLALQAEAQAYAAWLDVMGLPKVPRKLGQLIEGSSGRPYWPFRVDDHYEKAQQPVTKENEWLTTGQQAFGMLDIPDWATITGFVLNNTIQALNRAKASGKPWSIAASFSRPHPDVVTTATFLNQINRSQIPMPASWTDPKTNSPYANDSTSLVEDLAPGKHKAQRFVTEPKTREFLQLYYASLMETDFAIGAILDWLDQSGLANNTMIVYSSDHGDMMAAHGGMQGKANFYEEAVRVPLMFALPGVIPAGKTFGHPVSTLDLAPTVLGFLTNGAGAEKMQGMSLKPLLLGQNASNLPAYSIAQWGNTSATDIPTWMVRTQNFKLMMWQTESAGVDGYYDIQNDPHEMINLIGNNPNRVKYLSDAKQLKHYLENWLTKIKSPSTTAVINRVLH